MSKIAEKKALETYPKAPSPYYDDHILDRNVNCRIGYIKGYDQAMQDFLEYLKYCSTFTDMNGNTCIDNDLHNTLIEQFKNYMENEM